MIAKLPADQLPRTASATYSTIEINWWRVLEAEYYWPDVEFPRVVGAATEQRLRNEKSWSLCSEPDHELH